MKLFLAGLQRYTQFVEEFKPKYILESFAYIKQTEIEKLTNSADFLLDSGAFTFLSKGNSTINWTEYVRSYGEFINRNKLPKFFELDIYKIIGIKATEDLREKLEEITGRQSIPVWHRHLGLDYLHRLSEEYGYIGFGGFAIKDISPREYKFIPKLLDICKKNDCLVHGLGFTNQEGLKICKFYSVDSTSWNGGRFGTIFQYKNGRVIQIKQSDKRIVKGNNPIRHNFAEWIKFQRYAEIYL